MESSDITRLQEFEHGNGHLKRLYADLSLENAALKDAIANKLYGLLRGGKSWPTWSRTAAFQFSGPVRSRDLDAPRTIIEWSIEPSVMRR